jgi:type IV secretory pathway TrbL component
MRLIGYYHILLGLIFYSLGLLALYEGARSGVYEKLINADILVPLLGLLGLIIAALSVLWGIVEIGMGISDLSECEKDGKEEMG